MAQSIGSADAVRILIPMNKCENIIAGVPDIPVSQLVDDAICKIGEFFAKNG